MLLSKKALIGLCIGILLLGAWAQAGRAQPKPADEQTLEREGKALYQAGRYEEALRRFQKAYAVNLAPNHLANVAMCYQKLEKWDQSIGHFRRALSEGQGKLAPDELDRIRRKMDKILRITSEMRFEVNVAGAEVRIDKVVVGTTPLPGPIRLANGSHRVDIFHLGKQRSTRQFEVGPGYPDRITMVVVLPRPRDSRPSVITVVTPPKAKPFLPGWSLEAGIVGVVGTVAYVALGIPGFAETLKCPRTPEPNTPTCGLTGFYLYAGGGLAMAATVPTVFVGSLSTRRGAGVKGILGLQVASWVSYGLLALSAIGMAAFLMKGEPIHPAWPGTTLGVGAAAGVFMTVDAFVTHLRYKREAKRRGAARRPAPAARAPWQWQPLFSLARDPRGKVTPMLGLRLSR